MLEVSSLNVKYGQIHALRDVSLSVAAGRIVAVIGANGAGKSTLMMTLAGLLEPASGKIAYEGQPLSNKAYEVVGQGVCLVPERRRLYANLTVKENLLMGAFLRKDKDGILADLEKMYQLFPIMKERLKQYAGTLSGGEQQIVAIARGLMSRPRLLLLDEPSLGLAPLMVANMFQVIRDIRAQGTTILLAEQNAFEALEMADDAFVLETGRVILSGSGKDLIDDPLVKKAYLGINH
ncbi:amino acid/amide ABC transporter ATP-binding protein 2, HAAT family [Sporomusa malonica]|uniref:Amino acid/amide ABC transporter ATP-binding protein 2, HAAT family n=1 Tax=Sporomusa malonica TaxID=112901 RepID=A0A1W2C3F2_9FIRM|nr:amino acid/amide ABC transporter ATP-binding protein 2, HAAT family [Sporomusa malonica]